MPHRFEKHSDILSVPAQQNPDLIPTPSAEPRTEPCTHCGAPLAPFVVEHKLNCPHCGKAQNPIRWDQAMASSRQSAPIFDQPFIPQTAPQRNIQQEDRQHWGDVYPCPSCGHAVRRDFQECPGCGEHSVPPAPGVGPAGDQPQPMRWSKTAEISMPPESAPYEHKETALPYNPSAYEGEVEGMHPAAQYTYQRAVAQGAAPQAAMAAAQEKQGEMMKRTQEGQNTEGVQIPVISSRVSGVPEMRQLYIDLMKQGRIEEAHRVLEQHDHMLEVEREQQSLPQQVDPFQVAQSPLVQRSPLRPTSGFVPESTINRISHLLR